MRRGGTETRVRRTQFGFRSGVGTADALFVAKRLLDEAWSHADGQLLLLLLDWAKAFYRIDPASMRAALRRFGIPLDMIHMVESIYTGRCFTVKDGGMESSTHTQGAGISQGCPLSPFLFIIVMTVLLHDVDTRVARRFGWSLDESQRLIRDIVYADDTMLIEKSSAEVLQYVTDSLVEAGRVYGLELHWGKTFLLSVRHDGVVRGADGMAIQNKNAAVYLGGLLCTDGTPRAEVSRRSGAAWGAFLKLERVWRHANISRTRKVAIYEGCILPKIMYGLESLWLRKAERSKIDALHARCLRRALGIKCSYISRISNEDVLSQACSLPLSSMLLQRQLLLFGRIARMPDTCPQREVLFEPSSVTIRASEARRARGRPRQQWAQCVSKHAMQAAGSGTSLAALLLHNPVEHDTWPDVVRRYCLLACTGAQ